MKDFSGREKQEGKKKQQSHLFWRPSNCIDYQIAKHLQLPMPILVLFHGLYRPWQEFRGSQALSISTVVFLRLAANDLICWDEKSLSQEAVMLYHVISFLFTLVQKFNLFEFLSLEFTWYHLFIDFSCGFRGESCGRNIGKLGGISDVL